MNPLQYLLCGYILLARRKHRCESTFPLRICKQLVIAAFWYIKMVLTNVLAQYLCTRFGKRNISTFRPFPNNVQPVVNLFGYRRFLNRKVPALVQLNRKGEESSPSLCDLLAWKYQAVPLEYRFAGYSNIEPSALLLFAVN